MQTHRALAVASFAIFAAAGLAAGQPAQDWSFDGIDRIEIDGVSGDLVVVAGSGEGVTLEVEEDIRPAGAFRAEVDASGGTLRVREDWAGGSSRGSVEWTLRVPADADLAIVFDTASGDLEASGVGARFDFDTASGDIRLRDMSLAAGSSFDTASGDVVLTDVVVGEGVDLDTASGDVELIGVRAGTDFSASTASGNIRIERSEGIRRASTASGDVRVTGARLTGPTDFSSASGSVALVLDGLPGYDLELSSASGDVRLEAAFGDDFTLVMSKRLDRGRIDSPFEATRREEYTRNGQPYVRQTVVRGSGEPEIRLHTASGSIRVRQR